MHVSEKRERGVGDGVNDTMMSETLKVVGLAGRTPTSQRSTIFNR